jgi:hypothetical protein
MLRIKKEMNVRVSRTLIVTSVCYFITQFMGRFTSLFFTDEQQFYYGPYIGSIWIVNGSLHFFIYLA